MGLLACEAYSVTLDAEGAEHHSERQVHPLQDGTLLDVQLEVGDGVLELPPRLVDPVEVHAVLLERVRQGDALAVLEVAHVVRFQRAHGRARPEEAAAEAGTLLVGPVHEAQRDGTLLWGEGAHDFEGADYVQGAVEPASVRDGVYVPPEEDGPFRVTWRCGPDVAGLVGFYFGYAFYLLELAPEPLPRLLPLPRPSDTAGAVGAAGEVGELLEFFDGATGVYTFGLH